jgi:CD109 antigen
MDFILFSTGSKKMIKKVPDSITSWILTGFSVNPEYGLGLTIEPSKLEVFQPFFVSTNLPYSIKRGESILIPAIIFNYLEKDLTSEVFLHNEFDEFDFAETGSEEDIVEKKSLSKRAKILSVKANSGSNVSFLIKPKKVGFITIKITATTSIAGDAVERQLLVEPEGKTEYINTAILIDLREKNEFSSNIQIDVPSNAVPDSTKIEVSAIGKTLVKCYISY